jgi:asparagine synthetase B (glutamine-hydrolysing)
MCGIFGVTLSKKSNYSTKNVNEVLKKIAHISESRGKDSSGLAIRNEKKNKLDVVKGDIPIRQLTKSKKANSYLNDSLNEYEKGTNFLVFGHARLVTNGSQLKAVNNQPVVKDGVTLIHNGIITNNEELWEANKDISREYNIDTEIINSLLHKSISKSENFLQAVNNCFNSLIGTFSVAVTFEDLNAFMLATNNGSVYYLTNEKDFLIFASEAYYLKQLKEEEEYKSEFEDVNIRHLSADNGIIVNLENFKFTSFNFKEDHTKMELLKGQQDYATNVYNVENNSNKREVVIDPSIYINRNEEQHLYDLLEFNLEAIKELTRCSKCLLPETFPYINYDEQGVCNYCKNYKPTKATKSLDDLNKLVEPYRKPGNKPDCIVPFSGGRDSTYSLHIIKKELGLKPIAFTYDWGMVTDLARRNVARVCGKLGVENIIVSADIHWKRTNIRKNIEAWLKNPELGMIPLFMAGDKYFFYYCNQVKKQTGIDLNIWGINNLENTEFKTGFAGLPPKFDKKRIYSLSITNQLKLFSFVTKNVLKSPGYINQSILDSLGSFATRYIEPKKDYFHLFDYYKWDEDEINGLLDKEYNWETAIDTNTTWRIGDGTASFYNYVYYTVAGFSENDTFRSNQIREGDITREEGLELINKENLPRYETMRWYFEIVGVDFEKVIKTVNQIPKLY